MTALQAQVAALPPAAGPRALRPGRRPGRRQRLPEHQPHHRAGGEGQPIRAGRAAAGGGRQEHAHKRGHQAAGLQHHGGHELCHRQREQRDAGQRGRHLRPQKHPGPTGHRPGREAVRGGRGPEDRHGAAAVHRHRGPRRGRGTSHHAGGRGPEGRHRPACLRAANGPERRAFRDGRLDAAEAAVAALQAQVTSSIATALLGYASTGDLADYATAADLTAAETFVQSAIDAILAQLAALTTTGGLNLINAQAWPGEITWDLLVGTNTIRNLHATAPLSLSLQNDNFT